MEVDGEAAAPQFKLRCELLGHQEDVRSVCCSSDLGLITGSRDTTIKLWAEDGPAACSLVTTLTGNKSYVVSLATAPPGFLPGLPHGAIVSGSFDGVVLVWDVASGQPVHTYKGHEYAAAGVVVMPNGDVASASLDKTIRLWREGRAAGVLEGHEGPVLCLAVTPEGDLISGSGDTTLKRWTGTKCVATYKGHTDSVRGVAIVPGVGFVSGSHDCSLRVWALDGTTLAEMVGHTAIIYGVAASSSGVIASGSEDNTVRVWSLSGACLQVLEHPGCVWGVAFDKAGDLLTGCSDAAARLWSAADERQADGEAQATYTRQIDERKAAAAAAAAASAEGGGGGDAAAAGGSAAGALPPGVKVSDASALLSPGARDGETLLVREPDGAVAAYGWNLGAATWDKIGTVVDAPEAGSVSTGRCWHLGREWDRVFDVEMDSGAKLKLALDHDENPYLVADRFLAQYELPAEFKEQIVKFILDNTASSSGRGAATDTMPVTGGFCDPFTGGSASNGAGPPARSPPAAAPPQQQPFSVTGGFCDPFTGGSSSSAAPAARGLLPASTYLLFDGPPPADALRKKLTEFSAQLAPEAALSEQEAAAGGLLDQLLGSLPAAAAGQASLQATPELLALASRLLRWPAAQLFPGLDIARCLALHPGAAAALAAAAGDMPAPAAGSLSGGLAAAAVSGLGPPLQTALRLAANCFKEPPLRGWVLGAREALLDGFAGAGSGPAGSKGVRLGLASLLLNYAVAASTSGGGAAHQLDEAGGMQLLSAAEELLGSTPPGEDQAAARCLLAVGSLLLLPGGRGAALRSVAQDLGLPAHAATWAGRGGEAGAAAAEVAGLLK